MPRRLLSACVLILGSLLAVPAGAAEPAALTRIAFGSCADQHHPQPLMDQILAWRPELFLFLGDNVYGDDRSGQLTELAEAYRTAARLPGLARLRAGLPVMATWDDHDFGLNDAGAEFPNKQRSQALFADYWQLSAEDPRRHRPGVYSARSFGPPGQRVQVILLDTRYFRSPLRRGTAADDTGHGRYLPDPDPAKTMLGAEQWQWLAEQLRQPAELRLIGSSIQVLAEGHGFERWGNLPAERQRLFELLRTTGAAGVVLLSGDRHFGALYHHDAGLGYPLYELTSSGINRTYANAAETDPRRLGELYREANFGSIAIDWPAGRVQLALRGQAGRVTRSIDLALADLRPRP